MGAQENGKGFADMYRNLLNGGLASSRGGEKLKEVSEENEGYRNKGGRKFRANLRKFGKRNGLRPLFLTNKLGKFRANPANFAQIRPILFLSAFFGLTPPFITPPFVWFQLRWAPPRLGGCSRPRVASLRAVARAWDADGRWRWGRPNVLGPFYRWLQEGQLSSC